MEQQNNLENKVSEKPFYKRPSAWLGFYLGVSVFANTFSHLVLYSVAKQEAQTVNYGPNLKRKWEEYASKELGELTSYKMFIPFITFGAHKEMPPSIKVTDGQGNPLPVDLTEDGRFEIKLEFK